MKLRKRIALTTVLILIINLFAPYSILFNTGNTVSAATISTPEEKPIVLSNLGINSKKVLTVQIALVTQTLIKGWDIQLRVDTTRITPCRSTGAANTNFKFITGETGYYLGSIATNSKYADGVFRIIATEPTGGLDLEEEGYVPGTMADNENIGDPQLDELGEGYPIYYPALNLYFKVLDDSITEDTLPLDLFELVPIPPDDNGATSLKTGAKIGYDPDGSGKNLPYDISSLGGIGFLEAQKEVTSISVENPPTNTTYTHGDTVSLKGGTIEVTFDDGSTENVSMEDPNVTIVTGSPANASNPTVEIRYKGKTTTFPITINDPIESFTVKTPMTDLDYDHNDPLDFTGLTFEAIRKSGTKIPLTKDSDGINTDSGLASGELKASVDSTSFTSSIPEGDLQVKGKQVITFTYEGITATQTVIVNDRIQSIRVKTQPNKKTYKAGEALDLNGGVIEVTLASTTTADINLPDGSIKLSTHNVNLIDVKQQLTVSMGTFIAPETIDVEWYDYVTGVTLVEPTDVEYNIGEVFNLSGARIRPIWKVGGQKSVTLTNDMISPNIGITDTAGIKTITVTYTPEYQLSDGTKMPSDTFTKTFDVEVVNNIDSITITPPNKTRYKHGEALGTDGTITLNYADNTHPTVPFSNATITEADGTTVPNMSPSLTDYGASNKVAKTLKISYTKDGVTGTANYPIEIVNEITGIAVTSTDHKKQYNIGDSLDVTNLEITITRQLGTSTKSVTSDMVSTLNTSVENSNIPLTVTYQENGVTETTTYNVSVVDSVKRIVSVNLPKTNYKYNEELDLTGATITVEKGSGNIDVPLDESMITGYIKTNLGDQSLTITYGGQTKPNAVTVNVKDYVDGITINPDVVTGAYGTEMSKLIADNNITYTVHYAKAGDKTPSEALTASMVQGYNKNTTSPQSLKVNYVDQDQASATNGETIQGEISVTLANSITGIAITPPTKDKYNHGEGIDKEGATVVITYADSTTKNGDISKLQLFEADGATPLNMSPASFDNTNKLTKPVILKYTEGTKSETTNWNVTIINDIQGIVVISTDHKIAYNVNEPLDTSKLKISVTRAVGTPSIVDVTDGMVTGFSSVAETTGLPLTITYTENDITETTQYQITVADSVTGIRVKTPPPVSQKYNEAINLTGAMLEVTSGKGARDIPITSDMLSDYNMAELGDYTVKVIYGGFNDTFPIKVKDYVDHIDIDPSEVTGVAYGTSLQDIIDKLNVTYTVNYAKTGDKAAIKLNSSMLKNTTPYNPNTLTSQTLTFVYRDNDPNSFTYGDDIEKDFKVTLSNKIVGITITAPTKDTYNHGESIDKTGATVTLTYADTTTENGDLSKLKFYEADGTTELDMSPSAFDSTNKMTKSVKISYTEGGKTEVLPWNVTIINDIQGITVVSTDHKTSYNVNEALDTSKLKISVTRAVGAPSVVDVTNSMVSGFNSTVEATGLPLTITYTENGITETAQYQITVSDSVTGITIKTPPPVDQKYNAPIDLTGAKITVTSGKGEKDIDITSSMISDYDNTTLGNQTVTVTYGGQTTTFNVKVKDYVTGITVTPNSVNGEIGNELLKLISDNNITYTVNYAKGGASTQAALDVSMVPGYNKTSKVTQNLKAEYTDTNSDSFTNGTKFDTPFTVTLANKVTGIAIIAPTKDTYNHGENVDKAGAMVTITYSDGSTANGDISKLKFYETDGTTQLDMSPTSFDSTNKLTRPVVISYTEGDKTEAINWSITIINDIQGIVVVSKDHKTSYNVNEPLDTNNLKISVTRAVGTPSIVNVTPDMISNFDSSTETTGRPVTITYEENGITQNTTYNITVADSVTGISIKTPPTKDKYKYNEELDLTGAKITVTSGKGTKDIPITIDMISGFDKTILGDQTVTVTYGGQTATFVVNVKDYITGITVAPITVTGEVGAELSQLITDNNIKYTVNYAKAGAGTPTTLTPSMVVGYNPDSKNTQNLNVEYTDTDEDSFTKGTKFTTPLTVKLANKVVGATIKAPTKDKYKHGEALSTSGGEIILEYADGTKETKTLTSAMIKEANGSTVNMSPSSYDSTQKVEKILKIEYTAPNGTTYREDYPITIVNEITKIEIEDYPKTVYGLGEAEDLTGGTIKVTRLNGAEIIPLTNNKVTVTGFDSSAEGSVRIDVSYKENDITKSTSYTINVEDEVASAEIVTYPDKTDYEIGEVLDTSGGTIKLIKASGAEKIIDITNSMITGYDANKPGKQTLTITYDGEALGEYEIIVEDSISHLKVIPNKTTFKYGEELDLSGGTVQVIMKSGEVNETADLTIDMVSGYDKNAVGDQIIHVEYKGLKATFDVTVLDEIVNVTLEKEPDKTQYAYGENIDLTGALLKITMLSGEMTIPVGENMISGYNPTESGVQVITINFEGYELKFIVIVGEKPTDPTPQPTPIPTPVPTPVPIPAPTTKQKPELPIVEMPERPNYETPVRPSPSPSSKPTPSPSPSPRPTETLGVKDERKDNRPLAVAMTSLLGLLLLAILFATRRNTKIYIEENGKFELSGSRKLSKRRLNIDIDDFLDGDTYLGRVKIVLNKNIAKKLDGELIEIKHRGISKRFRVDYKDEKFEITLD